MMLNRNSLLIRSWLLLPLHLLSIPFYVVDLISLITDIRIKVSFASYFSGTCEQWALLRRAILKKAVNHQESNNPQCIFFQSFLSLRLVRESLLILFQVVVDGGFVITEHPMASYPTTVGGGILSLLDHR